LPASAHRRQDFEITTGHCSLLDRLPRAAAAITELKIPGLAKRVKALYHDLDVQTVNNRRAAQDGQTARCPASAKTEQNILQAGFECQRSRRYHGGAICRSTARLWHHSGVQQVVVAGSFRRMRGPSATSTLG
jgi:DNA polymerase/3'-5' exonuclease PolX